jgi:hypothetical protein
MHQEAGAPENQRAPARPPWRGPVQPQGKLEEKPGRSGEPERHGAEVTARMSDTGLIQATLSRFHEPQPTYQITIRSASSLSGSPVWYSLAHANGQNLWLSLREHAPADSGNHACKPRRAAEPSTRRQSRGDKSDGASA